MIFVSPTVSLNQIPTTSFNEIINWYEEVINKANHIFREDNIKKMFESFRENNFRENPVCEFMLGNEM